MQSAMSIYISQVEAWQWTNNAKCNVDIHITGRNMAMNEQYKVQCRYITGRSVAMNEQRKVQCRYITGRNVAMNEQRKVQCRYITGRSVAMNEQRKVQCRYITGRSVAMNEQLKVQCRYITGRSVARKLHYSQQYFMHWIIESKSAVITLFNYMRHYNLLSKLPVISSL